MIGQKRTGSREGGVEVVVGELASRMAALGHEVACFDRAGDGAPAEPYDYKGARVVPVKTVDVRGLAALTSSFFATRAALRWKPDVIHYHAEGPCVPMRLAKRAGVRTVATIHGLDWQRAKWGGFASNYIKYGERTAATLSDELIVLSRSVQQYFRDQYGRESRFVPNGVSPAGNRTPRAIKERWGLEEGSYVLFLGRIVPEKRPELLIKAFKGIETDKRLVIAGGSSDTSGYYAEVERLAAKDPRVVMTGFVDGDVPTELFSNACCYVLPSDVEGMPMSLLEAMSHACCCITSDIPECSDVLDGAGITFSKGSEGGLRGALSAAIGNSDDRRALGEAAQKTILSKYDWGSVVERTLDLYQGA